MIIISSGFFLLFSSQSNFSRQATSRFNLFQERKKTPLLSSETQGLIMGARGRYNGVKRVRTKVYLTGPSSKLSVTSVILALQP